MRRVALPLTLSLLAHAALAALVWLCPGPAEPRGGPARREAGPALRLSLVELERPRPSAPRPLEPDWNIDLEPPKIVPASASGEALSPLVVVPPSLTGGGSPDAGGPAGGISLAPAGSSLLPVSRRAEKVVYLLDCSASMGLGGGLDRAVAELKLSLRALPPDTLFQVFAYNRLVKPLVPAPAGLAAAEPGRVASVAIALDDLRASGNTDHAAALRRGLALRPDVLFLLTDAADLTDDQVRDVTRANHGGTAIHVVELTPATGPPDGPLARLAAGSAGTYRRVRP